MRPAALAAVSLVSATVGGIAVLLLGAATGQVGERSTETVIVTSPTGATETPQQPAAVREPAKPLLGNAFDPARLYASRADGVVTVHALFGDHAATGEAAQGSGFVVSADGHVLTNSHVITNAGEGVSAEEARAAEAVYVEFRDGDRVAAKVVGWDLFDDVGVLKVEIGRAHV